MRTLKRAELEQLRMGERAQYEFDPKAKKTMARCAMLKITAWVQKVKAPVTESDKALQAFIDIPVGYRHEYGITWQGQDYVVGDMPRDLGGVIHGMAIVAGLEQK